MCIMGTKKAGCGFGLSTPLETLESSEQQVGSAARHVRALAVTHVSPPCQWTPQSQQRQRGEFLCLRAEEST